MSRQKPQFWISKPNTKRSRNGTGSILADTFRAGQRWLAVLIACGLLAATAPILQSQPARCADRPGQFVSRDDVSFCFDGKPVFLYGATFYPYWEKSGVLYRSKGWLRPDFNEYVDTILDYAQAGGLNTLRASNYLDTAYSWDYPLLWDNMDYLISQAEARGLWVVLDLSTFQEWLEEHGGGGVGDAERWQPFIQFVAQRYQHTPAIAFYSILAEIPDQAATGLSENEYVEFYRQLLETLHTYDGGNHLISSGGFSYLNYDSGIPWESIFALPYNDMASIHLYSDGDRDITLPRVFTWARNRRMPLMVEEYGFQQKMGDSQRANAIHNLLDLLHEYDVSGTMFWNLGPEVAAASHDINPDTPAAWQVIQQHAP